MRGPSGSSVDVELSGPIIGATFRFLSDGAVACSGRHDEETMMTMRGTLAGIGMLLALPVAAQEMFFYPSQGQSPEQQNLDRGECQAWAVQQAGFDPASPPPPAAAAAPPAPQGGLLRGAARGAAVGAVGGAIAGDAGKGAAVGAGTGALLGGMRRRDQARAQAQQQAAAQQQYDAQLAQQRDSYNHALGACMQGRGYSGS
jgi:hypothetical protein